MSQAWGERSRLPNAGIDIDSDTHPRAHRSLDRNAYTDAYANSGTGSDTHADGDLCVTRAAAPYSPRIECHSECSEESKGFHPKTAQFCEQRLWILHFAPLRSE